MGRATKRSELTARQRVGLEHLEACAQEGVSVRAYARRRGLSEQNLYQLATVLRSKGVVATDGSMPLKVGGDPADAEGRERHELQERCLLYVAATRARDELAITGFGAPSPLLSGG